MLTQKDLRFITLLFLFKKGYRKKRAMAGLISSPANAAVLLLLLLLLGLVGPTLGGVLLSKLPITLIVTASPKQGQVLTAGVDKITVSWQLNQSHPSSEAAAYSKVKLRLCYAPVSQTDRGWRKTHDELDKDKTCQFAIALRPYNASEAPASVEYAVQRDVPTAAYFVRAYALDSSGSQVAYGQTTDARKVENVFEIVGISGRTTSIDIAAACFSAFAVAALAGFFVVEKRKAK